MRDSVGLCALCSLVPDWFSLAIDMFFYTGVVMRTLKLCNFQQFLERDFSCFCIAVNELGKILVSLVRQIAQLLVLCLPIFCEAGSFPKGQYADKEFNFHPGGHVGSCVRVFNFGEYPISYSWTGFVEVLAPVSPQVKSESGPKPHQETDEVKGNDVARYGLRDLIKDHGLWLLLCFVIGFLCFAGCSSRRY